MTPFSRFGVTVKVNCKITAFTELRGSLKLPTFATGKNKTNMNLPAAAAGHWQVRTDHSVIIVL